MPLWSNEDWRARIGSCWCALGRTFNTRFTRCRGKSRRDLSTHQAATMVIMMILFIAANMIMELYVTRERHKILICVLFGETITELHLFRFGPLLSLFVPVLKFVVQFVGGRLPRKLKMSLKQFFIDLNNGLWFIGSVIRTFLVSPVLFVVNFTTGNICNVLGKLSNHLTKLIGDRLSNGILMRSLMVVIVVTIQLLVSVMVARAIIFLLLLISGDVERNPGPENIDYSVTKELVVELETTAVQASLLLRCGDIESNPGPLTREGGVNQKRSIDKVVKSGQINDPDRMFNDLSFVIHDKYMEIGVELGLNYQYLHNELETGMSVTERGNKKAMKMLQLWQQSINKYHFTYSVLATALEKYGFHDAARTFCYTEATSNLRSKPQQCVETREAPTVNSSNNPPPTVASVAPTVNIPHDYHNYQRPHPSGSFMLHPPAHIPMHNQPSLLSHLHNQGVSPAVNIPHGYHNYQRSHPSSSFVHHPPVHTPMHNQPSLSPHLHNRGVSPTVNMPYGQHNHQSPHPSSSFMLPPQAHMPMHNQPSHLQNQGVSPTVNMPHGQHNYQSPHPSSSFMFPPQVHMPNMHNQPSHLHNQVNVPRGQHYYQSPHPSSSFMLPPQVHMPMHNQPSFSPHLHQGAPPIQSSPSRWTLYPGQSQDRGFESVPPPKRYKPDPPMGQVALSTSTLQGIDRWRQKLVNFYLAQEHVHAMDEWPPLKAVDFVTLALVKQNKQASHINLQTIQENAEAIYGQKINVCLNDLFQNIGNRALVLFEGRPGSGKTSLMVKISCDWGRELILKSKLVLLVRLRNLSKAGEIYLNDLLRVACPAFTPDDVQGLSSFIEGRLGEGVVFLLDGFDEYAPGASNENYISKLILKMVFSQSIVILSSRPAAAQRFRHRTTLWVEVVGFMKEQVLQYINCYFEDNKEKSSSLIQHLKEHHNLMNLCYLPLHCAMLVFLYKMDATLPETETEFYRDFSLSLIFRDHVRDSKLQPVPKLKSFDCLSDNKKEALMKVCKLAFEATISRRQVFEESEVHDICFKDSSENTSESLGLVVVDRYFAKSGVDETYTFLHLTLQEYLAAVFVSRLIESEQISTMATVFSHQHLFVTSRFLFGILDYSKQNTKKLFKQMLDATKDHLLHHIQCACESHSASACTDVVNFHDKNLSFQSISNSSDIFYITYVLKTSEFDAIELSFSECNFDSNDAVSLLQGVGDCQLSLIIKEGKAARSMLNALSRVTVSGLVELLVAYELKTAIGDLSLAMGPNHLKHSTNLRKLELIGIDISNSGLEEAFKFWPNLMKLKLDRCLCHVTSVAEVLGEGLQHMTKAHHTTDQTLDITLQDCDFNKEAAVGLLQVVGDRRLLLTISHKNMHMGIDVKRLLVDALCLVTLPGLIELNVGFGYDDNEYLTMRPNNLKHSTNLQKLKLNWLDISNSGLEKALKHWPNLVELELDHCHCHVTSVAEVLGEGLQHMTKAHHTTDQTLEITLQDSDFNKEAAVGLLQAVEDRRLLLTITYESMYNENAQLLVDALCLVTLPGLIELAYFDAYNDNLTMGPNNLKHSTYLQKLKLFRLDISNSGLEKALKQWPNLVELVLYRCHCHVTSVAEVLGEGLQHMTKAHHTTDQTLEITLQDCNFNKEAAIGLLQAVGDRRLSLTITYQSMNIQPLVDALSLVTPPGLIELNVSWQCVVLVGAGYPTNNLKHSTNLQKLKLFRLDVSNSGLEKALKQWPNLVELNLSGCKIDASTAVVLGESLQHTSKLQTLDLSNNSIGDDGLHALSLPIKNYLKELKELWLWKTQLTDRSITCLTEWIKVLNNLEKLNLAWNCFSEGGVKQIEEAVSERNTRKGVAELELDISNSGQLRVPYH